MKLLPPVVLTLNLIMSGESPALTACERETTPR